MPEKDILKKGLKIKPYEVIEEIEILREFAFGISADISRAIKKEKTLGNSTQILEILNSEIIDIYNNIFKIETLEDANICCGKLQIVNESIKKYNIKEC